MQKIKQFVKDRPFEKPIKKLYHLYLSNIKTKETLLNFNNYSILPTKYSGSDLSLIKATGSKIFFIKDMRNKGDLTQFINEKGYKKIAILGDAFFINALGSMPGVECISKEDLWNRRFCLNHESSCWSGKVNF